MSVSPTRSDLCRACGLCCTGALFSRVNLTPADAEVIAQAGRTVDCQEGQHFLAQPCPHHDPCAGCQIYESRFATCRDFRCKLLAKFDSGGIDGPAAAQTIATAKQLIELAGSGASTSAQRDARRANTAPWTELSDPEDRRLAAEAHLRLLAVDVFLDRHFRGGNDKARPSGATDPPARREPSGLPPRQERVRGDPAAQQERPRDIVE